jgi:membrane fusion protein (multidrug efflux system)
MKNEKGKSIDSKRRRRLFIPIILIVLIVSAGGIYYYIDYSKYISTDDAHIDGDFVSVSAKILGRLSEVYVEEGDTVKPGQLLVQLDSTDLVAQKKQLMAVKNQSVTLKEQAVAKYNYDQQSIAVLRINMERTQNDYERGKKQFEGNVISAEQIEHLQKTFETAKAQYDASQAQLTLSKTQINSTISGIKSAEAQIGVIKSQLSNTLLYAPGEAIVARKWLLNGDIAQPGQSILSLTNMKPCWVAVYIEETELANIYTGQKARFTIDSYPGVTFVGHVTYIGSSTAAQFSLIPPNNASGNFTKITQRIPLKISIDKAENGLPVKKYRILPGMSAEVKIHKK